MTNPDSELDNILCRLTTGYTRKELLEFPEEDTGLDKYEVEEELRDVNRAITKLLQWSAKREKHALMDGIAHGAIVDNIRLVVNSDIPAEWTTPVTNKKLYNEAAVAKRKLEARLDTAKTALKACPTKDDMLRLWLQQHIKDIKEIAALNKELGDL